MKNCSTRSTHWKTSTALFKLCRKAEAALGLSRQPFSQLISWNFLRIKS
jgi:hypothetical protein